MQITIYAKKRTSKDGRSFYNFLTRLTNQKTMETITPQVRFNEGEAPKPEDCPINIVVPKGSSSLSTRTFTDRNGGQGIGYTLFVKEWQAGDPYVDHSMDDFE